MFLFMPIEEAIQITRNEGTVTFQRRENTITMEENELLLSGVNLGILFRSWDALKVAPPHGLKLLLKTMRYSHGETNSKSFMNVKTQVLCFELWKFKLNQAHVSAFKHSKLLEATGLRSQADPVLLLIILKTSPLLNGDDPYMR
ncbi:hypothetical protein MTR67_001704 [Solanum verrucosum]|uniref:Uncharacterized protein n=1 Tax=Solanum verrucosum TaxID=315347 RepID=A0AAF0T834_SOLVR|nr:hypothetical protein MTR67_001704 [Solanum verrucosum]